MLLPFQNCGEPSHTDTGFLASLAGNFKGCDGPMKQLFAVGYYQAAIAKCASCHATGPGNGLFANSNFEIAYAGFASLGHVRWERNFVNAGHHPPWTGPTNQPLVDQYSSQFTNAEAAYIACANPPGSGGGGGGLTRTVGKANAQILARAQQANVNNRFAPLSFDLDVDILQADPSQPPVIKFPATFNIDVAVAHPAGMLAINSGYEFRNPTITLKAAAPVGSKVHVKGIRILVNGVLLSDLTTYSQLMADATVAGTAVNLAPGFAFGLGIFSPVANTDMISIQFDELSDQ